ncbi:Uncharacterized protein PCOAH_00026050 [Plasmodium coatneyi]|uniref:SICA antigen n=1 Tax=Plasmodium coatneyi TaxID=208452 RepID=A0A1B1DZK7_9APIC|nr:Uncharacterized protein PCOAH_00026050 [Plasmodium coatneyi]ANQ08027.1 Uncharacterized protein PCOAH_00026050 [Plasmodium coatneyi]
MAQDKVFGPLKEKWLEKKGLKEKGRTREGNLIRNIGKWINEFAKSAGSDNEGIGASGCDHVYGSSEMKEGIDKKVCAFILGNLWRTYTVLIEEGVEEVDREMKAYIYCTMMSAWMFLYQNKYCRANEVMNHAFEGMRLLCKPSGKGGKCYKCEYENLERMQVGDVQMLGYILEAVKKGDNAMGKMYKEVPEVKCKQENTFGQHHQTAGQLAEKKITAEHFHFITQLLTKWIMAGKVGDLDNFGTKIWAKFRKVLKEFFNYMETSNDAWAVSCDDNGWFKWRNYQTKEDRRVCKLMVDALYFKNWYKGAMEDIRGRGENEGDIEAHIKCVIASVFMYILLKSNCKRWLGIKYALKIMSEIEESLKITGHSTNKCEWMDYEDISLGGKVVGKTIEDWLMKNKGIGKKVESIRKNANCAKWNWDIVWEKDIKGEDSVKIVKLLEGKEKELEKEEEKTWTRPKELRGLWEEDEDLEIGEFFSEFSNNPIEGDHRYDYETLEELAKICEKESSIEGILDKEEDREFCRTLIKNLMIVTKDKLPCQKEKKDRPDMWDCIPKCDLLNTWLIYVRMSCKRNEVINHVFEKMKDMKGNVKYKNVFEECKYGQIKPWWRGDRAMMMEVYKFLMKEDGRSKIMEIHNQNWCGGKGIRDFVSESVRERLRADKKAGNEEYGNFLKEVGKVAGVEEQPGGRAAGGGGSSSSGESRAPAAPGGKLYPKPGAAPENDGKSPIKDKDNYDVGPIAVSADGQAGIIELSAGTHKDPALQGPPQELFEAAEEGTIVQAAPAAEPAADEQEEHSQTPHEVSGQPSSGSEDVQSSDPEKVEQNGQDASTPEAGSGESVGPSQEAHPKALDADIKGPKADISSTSSGGQSPPSSAGTAHLGLGQQGKGAIRTPSAPVKLTHKYFTLPGKRRRYRRAHQVRGPSLEQQLPDHVDDQADGPREYTLVNERQPIRRPRRSLGKKPVSRRTIIDIHLEVLDECQKGDVHSTKEDFFEILVREFMESEFIKE